MLDGSLTPRSWKPEVCTWKSCEIIEETQEKSWAFINAAVTWASASSEERHTEVWDTALEKQAVAGTPSSRLGFKSRAFKLQRQLRKATQGLDLKGWCSEQEA